MSEKDYFYYRENFIDKYIMKKIMKLTLPSLFVLFVIILLGYFLCGFDLFFIFTPLVTLSVPIMVISFTNKKEKIKNDHFLDILEDCIFEALLSLKLEFLVFQKSSNNEFKKDVLNDPTRDKIINNVFDILIDDLKIIEDSKLQFYDKDTFNKFIKYKRTIHQFKKNIENNKSNPNEYSKICYDLYYYLTDKELGLNEKTIENILEINAERIRKHKGLT